ncbi:MAG: hypothetical protein KA516_01710 [Providencia sp.]|nr:hypothetical protein [Providencia sp.]
MMRSESKEVYGTHVFGLVAMLHQLRRWWVIRGLRADWNFDRGCLNICKKHNNLNYLSVHFDVYRRYQRIRLFAKPHQQRGAI